MRQPEARPVEIEFPGRYVLDEARFPAIRDKIRNEVKMYEPDSSFR